MDNCKKWQGPFLSFWIGLSVVLISLPGLLPANAMVVGPELTITLPLSEAYQQLEAAQPEPASAIFKALLVERHVHVWPAYIGLSGIAQSQMDFPVAESWLKQGIQRAKVEKSPIIQANLLAELGNLYLVWWQWQEAFGELQPLPKQHSAGTKSGSVNIPSAETLHQWAIMCLGQAVTLAPNEVRVLNANARLALASKQLPQAETALRRALAVNPHHPETHRLWAHYYQAIGQPSRSRDSMMIAFELAPKAPEVLLSLALILAQQQHPSQALYYAKQAELRDIGTQPERLYLTAKLQDELGQRDAALQSFEKLIQIAPSHTATQQWLSRQKGPSQGGFSANSALAETMALEAVTLTQQEKIEEALSQWRMVASRAPSLETRVAAYGFISGLHWLRTFYSQGEPQEAQQDLETLQGFTQTEWARISEEQQEQLKLDQLKLKFAVSGQDAGLSQLITSPSPLVVGEAYYFQNHFKEAQKALEEVYCDTPVSCLLIADRLLLNQDLVSARRFYQMGLQAQPNEAYQTRLAFGLKRLEQKEELARRKLKEGNYQFDLKEYVKAAEYYEQAQQIQRQELGVYLRLGDVYEQLKQPQKAFKAYQMATQLEPNLLEAENFAKKYRKLAKKAGQPVAKK